MHVQKFENYDCKYCAQFGRGNCQIKYCFCLSKLKSSWLVLLNGPLVLNGST